MTGVSKDLVPPLIAVDFVIVPSATKIIVASATLNDIVAGMAKDPIVVISAVHHVITRTTINLIVA